MFGLKRFFSSKSAKKTSQQYPYKPELLFNNGNKITDCATVSGRFSGRMLGVNSYVNAELSNFESSVLYDMGATMQDAEQLAKMLPRVPMVLPRLMQSIRAKETTAQDIADLISQDAVLVADVMRLTKSPFYKTRAKITSLQHAVVLLGREGVQRLVASAILKPLIGTRGGFFMEMSAKMLWEHAEKTAQAAFRLSSSTEETRFHAYLAALLVNLGFTVGLKILDRNFDSSSSPHAEDFYLAFNRKCLELSATIAQSWGMPSEIVAALKNFSNEKRQVNNELEANLYVAYYLAQAEMLSDKLEFDIENLHILLNQKPCVNCQKIMSILMEEDG